MARKLHFRQLTVEILALVYDVSQKEMAVRTGMSEKSVSKYLQSRERDIPEHIHAQLLSALPCQPAAVEAVTACLEALESLEQTEDLTTEDRRVIEEGVLLASRVVRGNLTHALRRARAKPEPGYPQPADLVAHRFRAGEQLERLRKISAEQRVGVVRRAKEFQTWALCERLCEESTRQAGRDVKECLAWAQFAREVADRVEGPEGWVKRVQAYALAHVANAIRVAAEYPESDTLLTQAKSLWQGGADPNSVLDPGRLLDLEASLRRDQRRFEEALSALEQAAAVSHNPARLLVKKGSTLEVKGDYEGAVEALLQALPLAKDQSDPRLDSLLRLNLANNFCHLGRFREALELVREARSQVFAMGAKLDLLRVMWLEGRIAGGLGQLGEARRLLAETRRRFVAEGMFADAALATLEEAILLLEQGEIAEVKGLARELAGVLKSKGFHREALAALRLFQEAAESDTVTVTLARDILVYLYQTRHDQGIKFGETGSH
jgi:tetratricopeptide (TPR) repeat protein